MFVKKCCRTDYINICLVCTVFIFLCIFQLEKEMLAAYCNRYASL